MTCPVLSPSPVACCRRVIVPRTGFHQYLNSRFDTVFLGAAAPHKGLRQKQDESRIRGYLSAHETPLVPAGWSACCSSARCERCPLFTHQPLSPRKHFTTFYPEIFLTLEGYSPVSHVIKRSQNIPEFIRESPDAQTRRMALLLPSSGQNKDVQLHKKHEVIWIWC